MNYTSKNKYVNFNILPKDESSIMNQPNNINKNQNNTNEEQNKKQKVLKNIPVIKIIVS